MRLPKLKLPLGVITAVLLGGAWASNAAAQTVDSSLGEPTYADLADLADASQIVLRAEIRKQAEVEPERSPGLQPGFVRLYVEARTGALISGTAPIGESLRYLVDVPLDSRGKTPKLKKREVLLFANTVAGSPGAIRLVGPRAQLLWNDGLEARLRPILGALLAADSPPVVTGVRDALTVPGNLAGESETQLFLDTEKGDPVSITVVRRPQQLPVWGVSWSEIVDQAARPPQPQSIAWYRLACFLPARLPDEANLSREPAMRNLSDTDYAFVMSSLGSCDRNLGG